MQTGENKSWHFSPRPHYLRICSIDTKGDKLRKSFNVQNHFNAIKDKKGFWYEVSS